MVCDAGMGEERWMKEGRTEERERKVVRRKKEWLGRGR